MSPVSAAVIAGCVSRMAAVNMAARVCGAAGGQVLLLIKCASLSHLPPNCSFPLSVRAHMLPAPGQAGSEVRGRSPGSSSAAPGVCVSPPVCPS